MKQARRALIALMIASAILGASLALAQALPSITAGAPAQTLHVPAVPGVPLVIATAGEYQIDATGSSLDTELSIVLGDAVVAEDSDSGDGTDARVVTFLEPGTYDVRASEHGGRATTARLSVIQAPPMTAVASIAPGAAPASVQVALGASPRESSVELTLTIAGAGAYRIVAEGGGLDAELLLIRDGSLVEANSDASDGPQAHINRDLTPGEYTLRVRDRSNRAGTLSVSVIAL